MEKQGKVNPVRQHADRIIETMEGMAQAYTAGDEQARVQKKAEMIGFIIALELCQANTGEVKRLFAQAVGN